MTNIHAINNLGTATKIPNKILNMLVDNLNLCIASAVNDAKIAHEDFVVIDIGVGNLSVDVNNMQCKFMPSKELKNAIKQSAINNIDPLEIKLEEEFRSKLLTICSEVL